MMEEIRAAVIIKIITYIVVVITGAYLVVITGHKLYQKTINAEINEEHYAAVAQVLEDVPQTKEIITQALSDNIITSIEYREIMIEARRLSGIDNPLGPKQQLIKEVK